MNNPKIISSILSEFEKKGESMHQDDQKKILDNTQKGKFNELECVICTDILVRPVTLPCQHTFCRSCIERSEVRKCPNCRGPKTVPQNDNFMIKQLVMDAFPNEYAIRERQEKVIAKTPDQPQPVAQVTYRRLEWDLMTVEGYHRNGHDLPTDPVSDRTSTIRKQVIQEMKTCLRGIVWAIIICSVVGIVISLVVHRTASGLDTETFFEYLVFEIKIYLNIHFNVPL